VNIKNIADGRMWGAIYTGWIIHLSWLMSVGIGATSLINVVFNYDWQSIPVVLCSLAGGTIGTWYPMRKRKKEAINSD